MDRGRFYADVHRDLFHGHLRQEQVDGMNAILAEAVKRKTATNRLAYVLATVFHETAETMEPIQERGARSYFHKYEPGTRIGKMLGNTLPGDGYNLRGRGFDQITGRRNYAKASKELDHDFLAHPDDVMLMQYAVPILFVGMEQGWFTGRDLDDYIDDKDESDDEDLREYMQSRKVINGTDKAEKIGRYALKFEHALRNAGYSTA